MDAKLLRVLKNISLGRGVSKAKSIFTGMVRGTSIQKIHVPPWGSAVGPPYKKDRGCLSQNLKRTPIKGP